MPQHRLTDTFIKRLAPPETSQVLYRDTDVSGLALRITKSGAKTFVFGYSVNGRERRMRIGGFPDWSVGAARDHARILRMKVDTGHDPLEELETAREAPTLANLWEVFRTDHLPNVSQKHAADQVRYWDRFILPQLGKTQLVNLKSQDVDTLHRKISVGTPVMANRVQASLRKALNFAIRLGWVSGNVAEGGRSNKEAGRERYLSDDELKAFFDVVGRMPNRIAANALTLLLLTGARRSEVFGAQWQEFDLVGARWVKPAARVKSRLRTTIPLSGEAIKILTAMKAKSRSDYLFPAKIGGPIKDINKPWLWLLKETGLQDFRIHDLRHTHASILVSEGQTLEVIGRLLGHSQTQTTARYAHLMDDPLRKAISAVDSKLAKAKSRP
jgi:integrase